MWKAKGSRSDELPLSSASAKHSRRPAGEVLTPGSPQKPGDHPGNTAFPSAFSPPPLPVRHTSSLGDRFPVRVDLGCGGGWEGGAGWGSQGLTSASPPARRARPSHGERREAIPGPVHPPGHQFCCHRRPVLRVQAKGPGRPRAQGQCSSLLGLTRVIPIPGNGVPWVLRGPPHRGKPSKRGNRIRKVITWPVNGGTGIRIRVS